MRSRPTWIQRRQALVREREAKAVGEWLQGNVQSFEHVVIVDGVPAVARAIEGANWKWTWAPFVPFALAVLVGWPWRAVFFASVFVLSLGSARRTKGYFVAVTDRRFLLQRLKRERGEPVGPPAAYPLRNVTVLRFTPARGRSPYAVLRLVINEPSGPRTLTLGFHKFTAEQNVRAIKEALEQQGPNFPLSPTSSPPPDRREGGTTPTPGFETGAGPRRAP